jgi:hypothetical protein
MPSKQKKTCAYEGVHDATKKKRKTLEKKIPAHIGRFAPEGVHDATKKKENPAAIA